ncbi:ribulose-phosphate 3-epimerase [Metamycoplasma hyosynoviae]|uniref:ribulose-phosphate 3-epimerase n=1 Tax=Metamycoplasma hyosynoviae TaxID=29559 RepID=UPI0023611ECE|nr:ribulose-phosphate 3-epimerase [Metamycoplasma hyosynoviae]MDD1359237.1 ribulose-phosphate 3-epimerase [Metamycoplasma hyosynoviae]MDD1360247.1 ribulose-phosphate 3-epimerase [Metamycoplasma hyosynoviae]MDD1377481.1 ribulose-phosphate 3-epimerase [Metamycoplasma hyosynoviae]MDD1378849.1 ribulose-phosphate 3-epimerase [Metamycoplasma hyosynoviae]MDD7893274.1 ribulose-phosphate 3-epimerase [Metamycoplasma hyosynoviae]
MKKISPSILDVKENQIDYVNTLIKWGISNIHYDVMDGEFVPNTALSFELIEQIKVKCSKHIMDIHLMVKDVKRYYEMYKNIGDILTFHFEALNKENMNWLILQAKNDNVKIGLALNPDTNIDEVRDHFKHFALILVMSVFPGKGGQSFIEDSFAKIQAINKYKKENNLQFILQVDGGIKDHNIKSCFDAGINLAVVGSYLVKNFSRETVDKLLS